MLTTQSGNPSTTKNSLLEQIKSITTNNKDKYIEFISDLEKALSDSVFEEVTANEIKKEIFDNSNIMCRNESVQKVFDIIEGKSKEIKLRNFGEELNLNACAINGGAGMRIALEEGFGGRDVDNKIQTVISFDSSKLEKRSAPKENEIWKTKPATAVNSYQISGVINDSDIRMITLRIPTALLTEEYLEDNEINPESKFIVKHFYKNKKAN